MRGSSILRYCSTCNNNMWHRIDMCGKCGTTNTTKHKERCRCCGGLFDSLIQDHPSLQGQCETCVENYEKEKQVSSDRYACAGCEKYFHELDLSKDKDGNLLCAPCCRAYDAGRTPRKGTVTNTYFDPMDVAGLCPSRLGISVPSGTSNMTYRQCCTCGKIVNGSTQYFRDTSEPFMCIECRQNADEPILSRALEPDNSHYTRGGIEPWTYIQANDLNFFEGSVVKYVTRWRHKNGVEDLRKARVYIDELIRQEEAK